MYTVSAADAISPAIQRTRMLLFRPFRWSTFLKLSLVALITEGIGGNSNFSSHGRHVYHPGNPGGFSPFAFTPATIAAAVAAVALALLLAGWIYYLITRLRFAYFHCLIHNTKLLTPGWHLYRSQASRFFWLNVVVGCCFLLVVLVLALLFGAGIWRLVREGHASGHLDIGWLLTLIVPLIPILLLLVLAGFVADLVLRDWMLPHYALENASAGAAWSAVWARIQREKGAFFGYALLRVILPIIALVALFIVLIIPGLLFVASTAVVEVGIHAAFSSATGGAAAMGIFLQVLIGVAAFCLAFLAGICLGGPISTALREYALVFYGGRYQPLGDILFPPSLGTPPPPTAA